MTTEKNFPGKLTYSVAEATQVIGVGRTFLYRLSGAGILNPRKIGKKTVFLVSEINDYVASLPKAEIKPDPNRRISSSEERAASRRKSTSEAASC